MRTRSRWKRHAAHGLLALVMVRCRLQASSAAATHRRRPAAPAAPPPAHPTVTLQASPTIVQRGQSVTLTWSSTNATSLNLAPGVGTVAPQGSQTRHAQQIPSPTRLPPPGRAAPPTPACASPSRAPPPPPAAAAATHDGGAVHQGSEGRLLRSSTRPTSAPTRATPSRRPPQFLRSYPQVKVIIEGHCDERGSTEYNLALGDRRAQAAKDFLVSLGVAADRMQTVSYGKERPFCTDHNEDVLAAESPRALRHGKVAGPRRPGTAAALTVAARGGASRVPFASSRGSFAAY